MAGTRKLKKSQLRDWFGPEGWFSEKGNLWFVNSLLSTVYFQIQSTNVYTLRATLGYWICCVSIVNILLVNRICLKSALCLVLHFQNKWWKNKFLTMLCCCFWCSFHRVTFFLLYIHYFSHLWLFLMDWNKLYLIFFKIPHTGDTNSLDRCG